MSGFMVRVRKADVMKDLPPIRWDVVPVQPDATPTTAVPAGLSDDDLLKYLSGATNDEHVMRLRHQLGVAKVKAAVEYIDDFMESLPKGKKVLVFAHHKDVIAALVNGLQNWSPVSITGSSTPQERSNAVNDFLALGKHRIMIGNIAAAGTGLTLVGPFCKCSDVIFVEATYSVGDNHQAACRVHRIGQSDAVVARMLTAHGTIDDRIQSILARKAQDFEQLFN
jgi:SNF2 family DNA or RNA helicase